MVHRHFSLRHCACDRPLMILQYGQPVLSDCRRNVSVMVSGFPPSLHFFMHCFLHASAWGQQRRKPGAIQSVSQSTLWGYVYVFLLALFVAVATVLFLLMYNMVVSILLVVAIFVTPLLKPVKPCFPEPCNSLAKPFLYAVIPASMCPTYLRLAWRRGYVQTSGEIWGNPFPLSCSYRWVQNWIFGFHFSFLFWGSLTPQYCCSERFKQSLSCVYLPQLFCVPD